MSHQIEKTALVMHSAQRMFHLVNDISSYPDFLPWCAGAEIHQQSETEIMASLDVAKGGVSHRFTTRNQLVAPEMIDMTLVDGPFRMLCGHWKFQSLDANACKVILNLEFELASTIAKMAFGPVFSQAANTMVDAFCRRADQVYRGQMA